MAARSQGKSVTRIILVALLLAATCFPFVIMNGFHIEEIMHQQQLPSSFHSQAEGTRYSPIDCTQMLQNNDTHDPNRGMDKETTKRLTITDPQFYISLHKEYYDKMRWVSIMKNGEYYEKGITALFHRILSQYDVSTNPPPLVIDIGMNIGWFTLYSRAHGHHVASFDPNPVMFFRVCESLRHNSWYEDKSITLWNYGLGAHSGVLNLTLGNNPGGSSFHENRLAKRYRRTLPVEVVTLDGVAKSQGWMNRKISLMKVDVEGYENYVFQGGQALIYNSNVQNILMENSIQNITVVSDMVDFLYSAGYRLKEILSVHGDPYLESWWDTFNPMLEERHNKPKEGGGDHDDYLEKIGRLAKITCNIWWQHRSIML